MKVLVLIPFLIYLFLLIIFGIYSTRNVSKGMSGFFLGDRKINHFVVAISSVVSARGAWILMGVTTYAYIMGLSSVWLVVGFILSELLLFLFFAPVLRKYSELNGCITITDIFTSHFSEGKKWLGIIVSTALLLFSLFFISSQFIAGGRAFYALLGLTITNGIIITGIVVLFYAFLGGFKTMIYSDIFNSIIILAILISLPIIIIIRWEGVGNLQTEILQTSPDFFNLGALSVGTLVGFLSIGLGSPGNSNILVKFMSVKIPKYFWRMALVNTLTNIIMAAGAVCIGIFAKVYFPGSDSIPGADEENIFIGITGTVFHPLILGVVLVSIVATVMSSAGSQLLVSTSTLVNEIFEKSLHPGKIFTQAKISFYSRIVLVFLVYIAIVAGIFIDPDLYRFMLFVFAGLGASIGPAIIFTLFWRDVTSTGIKAGVIAGSLTVILWKITPELSDRLFEFAPGFITATLTIWIVSMIDNIFKLRNFEKKASYKDIKKNIGGTDLP